MIPTQHGETSKGHNSMIVFSCLFGILAGGVTFGFLLLDYHFFPARPFGGVPSEEMGGLIALGLAIFSALFLKSRYPRVHLLNVRESFVWGGLTSVCMGLTWALTSVAYISWNPQYRFDMIRDATRQLPAYATAAASVGAHFWAGAQYEAMFLIPSALIIALVVGLAMAVILRVGVNRSLNRRQRQGSQLA
jgi:hypothetical protein